MLVTLDHCLIWVAMERTPRTTLDSTQPPAYGLDSIRQLAGPFAQDLLAKYIRNQAIWVCPSLNLNEHFSQCPWTATATHRTDLYRVCDDVGMSSITPPTSYMYPCCTWKVNSYTTAPLTDTEFTFLGGGPDPYNSGQVDPPWSESRILRPSKCSMFWDMPCWETLSASLQDPNALLSNTTDLAHKTGANVVFFDGHVKAIMPTGQFFPDRICDGFGLDYIW